MPARSQAQRAYLNMKFGHAWTKAHGFDNKGKLPAHAAKRKGPKGSRQSIARRAELISNFQRKHGRSKR